MKSERGIAILETVGVGAILITALISAFAVSVWISRSYNLSHLLDRSLVESPIAAYSYSSSGIGINPQVLQNFVDKLADSVEQSLLQSDIDDDNANLAAPDYLVQVGYAVADFNPKGGSFLTFEGGAQPAPLTYLATRGELSPSTENSADAVLLAEFNDMAAIGSIPLPSGSFTSRSAFVGAVVYLRSNSGLAPYFFSLSGKEPILIKTKVVALRGGAGL